MKIFILVLILLSNIVRTNAQDEVVNYDISSNIQLVGLAYNAQICTGEEIEIRLNNVSISTTNTHYKWANFDDCIAYYNLSVDYQEENTSLVWSGEGIRYDPANRNVVYARPNSAGVYSVKWESIEFFPANKCRGAYKKTTRYSGTTRQVNIIPLTQTAEISGYSTKYPGTSSNAIALQVNGCREDESIIWQSALSNSTYINNIYYIFDTGSCNEYKVRCNQPRCNYPEKWSNPVKPANYFKPKDAAYSSEYANYLQRKLNESINKPEFLYRKQFTCIYDKSANEYNKSGDNGWGGGFVKHLFDNMATQSPCVSGMDKECTPAPYLQKLDCLSELGDYHFEKELRPSFFNYNVNTEEEIANWTHQHQQFLTNAVEACVDEIFTGDDVWSAFKRWGLKLNIVDGASRLRTEAQIMIRLRLAYSKQIQQQNISNIDILPENIFSPPPSKQELFSTELFNASKLKITADTNFFVQVGNSYQLRTIFVDDTNNTIDVTPGSSGTTYILSVDTTVATISSNGLLKIKSTTQPIINDRLVIFVYAQNNDMIGFGQFAIYDLDNDSDYIVNSFESRIGLNPNVKNDAETSDLDYDGVLDLFETIIGSNPLSKDSDNDGFSDERELKSQTNLSNSNSFPIPVYSINSGDWNNPLVWSCECTPTSLNDVIINEGHAIILPPDLNAESNTILIKTGAVFSSPIGTKLNILNLNK
ncbi:hypothetical protein [Emticicia sp. BO119]|uniref:hypothetical protein n=1 Tax=Emticicia sp. BO119 TaxID=2757768 RepID=UPI0015F0208D|nr:hypothetical protein [Emticicia sp. BO119]MBA4851373.1 hypothetical protein [Emticicia sp. BO119]